MEVGAADEDAAGADSACVAVAVAVESAGAGADGVVDGVEVLVLRGGGVAELVVGARDGWDWDWDWAVGVRRVTGWDTWVGGRKA